jgi:hypothetical protein
MDGPLPNNEARLMAGFAVSGDRATRLDPGPASDLIRN